MQKKQKINILLGISVVFLLLPGVYFFFRSKATLETHPPIAENQAIKENPAVQLKTEASTETKQATLEIADARYKDEILEGTSVYDFMNKFRVEGKINFKDKTYTGMGKFIEEINGIRGDGVKYWIYYVNGKKAQVGVSNYKINPGDVVSWRYEKDMN